MSGRAPQPAPVSLGGRLERRRRRGLGAPFAPDADFVNIRGDLHSGREEIAAGHLQIFDSIYAGSTVRYTVLQARELDNRVVLAHVGGTLNAPTGPLAALASVVLVGDGDEYRIAAPHNTVVASG